MGGQAWSITQSIRSSSAQGNRLPRRKQIPRKASCYIWNWATRAHIVHERTHQPRSPYSVLPLFIHPSQHKENCARSLINTYVQYKPRTEIPHDEWAVRSFSFYVLACLEVSIFSNFSGSTHFHYASPIPLHPPRLPNRLISTSASKASFDQRQSTNSSRCGLSWEIVDDTRHDCGTWVAPHSHLKVNVLTDASCGGANISFMNESAVLHPEHSRLSGSIRFDGSKQRCGWRSARVLSPMSTAVTLVIFVSLITLAATFPLSLLLINIRVPPNRPSPILFPSIPQLLVPMLSFRHYSTPSL
ncbi:hypothetical protein BDM02DRAFT_2864136 [Thelephora ganbajun]|uniref:Uncharacterized protein n=1 Tax=Thelephora ganbajun TaxID=370292 RepID=A0ACB6ZBG0_THEGA|nr:hypothetical protein BDM02DRAFT_2864136 [Thelephora ganbajun]